MLCSICSIRKMAKKQKILLRKRIILILKLIQKNLHLSRHEKSASHFFRKCKKFATMIVNAPK